jgi:CBS domain-containing protein
VVALKADDRVEQVRQWLDSGIPGSRHQGFPVLDGEQILIGVLTRRDLLDLEVSASSRIRDVVRRAPKFVYEDSSVRQAADHMANHDIGRLPVMTHHRPPKLLAMITRSDIVSCFRRSADDNRRAAPTITFAIPRRRGARASEAVKKS